MHAMGQQNLSPNAIFQRVLARQPILNEFVVIFGYKFFNIQWYCLHDGDVSGRTRVDLQLYDSLERLNCGRIHAIKADRRNKIIYALTWL